MKVVRILFFVSSLFLLHPSEADAQVRVNINIDLQPQWGPENYDYVEYYYLPEAEIYYFAPKAQFIYRHGNRWVYANRLPYQYRNLDLYSTYKVVVNEPRPYLRHTYYASQYRKYKSSHSKQRPIRESKDSRYRHAKSNRGNAGSKLSKTPTQRNVQPRSENRKNQNVRQQSNDRKQKESGKKANKGRK